MLQVSYAELEQSNKELATSLGVLQDDYTKQGADAKAALEQHQQEAEDLRNQLESEIADASSQCTEQLENLRSRHQVEVRILFVLAVKLMFQPTCSL